MSWLAAWRNRRVWAEAQRVKRDVRYVEAFRVLPGYSKVELAALEKYRPVKHVVRVRFILVRRRRVDIE